VIPQNTDKKSFLRKLNEEKKRRKNWKKGKIGRKDTNPGKTKKMIKKECWVGNKKNAQ
jgi:hypothetical protein